MYFLKCLLLSETFIYDARSILQDNQKARDDLTCFAKDNLETVLPFGSHVRSRTRGTHPRNLRALTTGIILRSRYSFMSKTT